MTGSASDTTNASAGVLGIGLTLGISLMIQWGVSLFGS